MCRSNQTEMFRFETANFIVRATIQDDTDVDTSFDETDETRDNLQSGEWQAFGTIVTVEHNGVVLGQDSLWGSIYANPADFFKEHVGLAAKIPRRWLQLWLLLPGHDSRSNPRSSQDAGQHADPSRRMIRPMQIPTNSTTLSGQCAAWQHWQFETSHAPILLKREGNNMRSTYSYADKPMAAPGLTSYRCICSYGWIMIGAKDHDDAMRQANRSSPHVSRDGLEVWNGTEYVKA